MVTIPSIADFGSFSAVLTKYQNGANYSFWLARFGNVDDIMIITLTVICFCGQS